MKKNIVFYYCLFISLFIFSINSFAANNGKQPQEYIYLCNKKHNISQFIFEMSRFDTDKTSPINMLNNYLRQGFIIFSKEDVMQVLDYVNLFLEQNNNVIDEEKKNELFNLLCDVINAIIENKLAVDMQSLQRNKRLPHLVLSKAFALTRAGDPLAGDVTGTTDATVVSFVAGETADNVASATIAANSATSANLPSTIVTRDYTGSFNANVVIMNNGTVKENVNLLDTTSSTVGVINKSSTRFMHNYGLNNTFLGRNSGNFTMTGSGSNVGVGINTLFANTTGNSNTAVGYNALSDNTTGYLNVAIGASALSDNTTGSRNTAVGVSASGLGTTAYDNTAIGTMALAANISGAQNTAIGARALIATKGNNTTGVGYNVLASNTTGAQNTAMGYCALNLNTTGGNNVALGSTALYSNVTGSFNTAVGNGAGGGMTSGFNNVFVGYAVPGTVFSTGSNNIFIDGSGSLNNPNENSTIRIGNTQTRCFISGIRGITTANANAISVVIDSTGQLGTVSSSKRFKHNIESMADISCALFDLNPVTFIYNSDETETTQFGLIAEEVDKVFPELVVHESDGTPYTVKYEILPVLLLNEMKKQKSEMAQQRIDIDVLMSMVSELQHKLNTFMMG